MIWLKVLLNDYFGSSTYVSYWAKSVQYLKWFLTVLWLNLKDILFIKWHINGTLLSEHANLCALYLLFNYIFNNF